MSEGAAFGGTGNNTEVLDGFHMAHELSLTRALTLLTKPDQGEVHGVQDQPRRSATRPG